MYSIEVLVAAMNQKNADLYQRLGLRTDAVIANQTDHFGYEEYHLNGNTVKVISTNERGVGKNRNMALLNASADICLLGDDDLTYQPDYAEIIQEAFAELPDADMIIFNLTDATSPDKRIITKISRVRLHNFLRYGAPRIAFRRMSLLKANIWFSLLYGGGTKYSSGEDNLFLREALARGLKIYTYPRKIAETQQETSSWFKGFNEKYFFDRGVLIANAFPQMKHFAVFYTALHLKSISELSIRQTLRSLLRGIKAFKDGITYEEWKEKTADIKQVLDHL
jgi:glycosyltransferase involved in cell wall biosynthesis